MGTTIKDAITMLSELDQDMELALYVAEEGTITASTAEVRGFIVEPAADQPAPRWLQHPARVIVDYGPLE